MFSILLVLYLFLDIDRKFNGTNKKKDEILGHKSSALFNYGLSVGYVISWAFKLEFIKQNTIDCRVYECVIKRHRQSQWNSKYTLIILWTEKERANSPEL